MSSRALETPVHHSAGPTGPSNCQRLKESRWVLTNYQRASQRLAGVEVKQRQPWVCSMSPLRFSAGWWLGVSTQVPCGHRGATRLAARVWWSALSLMAPMGLTASVTSNYRGVAMGARILAIPGR